MKLVADLNWMVVGRERLGVMEGRGLSGPFCWAVSMWRGAARIAPVHASQP